MSNQIEDLVKKLKEASERYYKNGTSPMTDAEYDMNIDLLKMIDPDNDFLKNVGSDLDIKDTSKWKKITHEYPLGSLDKIQKIEELSSWLKSTNNCKSFVVQEKLDGISLGLTYENGKLIEAGTRGDGCCDFNTEIEFDNGTIEKIGNIVENKINGKVKCYNILENTITYENILDWSINNNDNEWFEIEYQKENINNKIILTGNHRVFLPLLNCYRRVDELTENDEILID
jgi:hypothetical protein